MVILSLPIHNETTPYGCVLKPAHLWLNDRGDDRGRMRDSGRRVMLWDREIAKREREREGEKEKE